MPGQYVHLWGKRMNDKLSNTRINVVLHRLLVQTGEVEIPDVGEHVHPKILIRHPERLAGHRFWQGAMELHRLPLPTGTKKAQLPVNEYTNEIDRVLRSRHQGGPWIEVRPEGWLLRTERFHGSDQTVMLVALYESMRGADAPVLAIGEFFNGACAMFDQHSLIFGFWPPNPLTEESIGSLCARADTWLTVVPGTLTSQLGLRICYTEPAPVDPAQPKAY